MCGPEDEQANLGSRPYRTRPEFTPASASGVGAPHGALVVEPLHVTYEGYTYRHGVIAYIVGRPPSPIVLVHHNYAGSKQFDFDQAAFLARCGYVGVAIDTYREEQLVGHPDSDLKYPFEDRDPRRDLVFYGMPAGHGMTEAQSSRAQRHWEGAFAAMYGLLRTPIHWRGLLKTWLDRAREHPAAHPSYAGAIGYCLGGQSILEQVRAGHDLQAVVAFHGLLHSRPECEARKSDKSKFRQRMTQEEFEADDTIVKAENKYAKDCKVLIENGDLDDHVPIESLDEFRAEMDAAQIDWQVNNHARTPHGFALPPGHWATGYHEDADRRSTLSMLRLFAEVWPEYPQYPVRTNACGTVLGQSNVLHSSKL